MIQFIRNHSSSFIAVGTGVALGVSVTLIYHKVTFDAEGKLQRLAAEIAALRREVEALKTSIETNFTSRKKRLSGYYSIHASSGDEDDDEFMEASEEAVFETKPTPERSARTSSSIPNGEAGAEAGDLFENVDQLLDGKDNEIQRAYELLHDRESDLGKNADFMWRYSKATYLLAGVVGNEEGEEAKKNHIYRAHDYASRAILLNDNNASAHKWYAITIAGVGDYEGTQVKLQNGFKYREHIEKAIQLNPNDSSSYYLLGRWLYAVYSLSWLERQAAARIFGTNISADIDDALKNFMEAERIKPGNWKENILHIAKCHIAKSDYYTAVTWLDKANEVPTVSQSDKDAQQEIDTYLYKYSGYRS